MNAAPVVIFLLPGFVGLLLWMARPGVRLARALAVIVASAMVVLAAALLAATARGEVLIHVFGDWRPPFGLVFVADRLAALFIALQAVVLLVTVLLLRPRGHGEEVVRRALPLLFLLSFGLIGAFLTGDLFNLFVMFELVLISSYLLLQVPGSGRSLRAAFPNVVVNLLASLLFFTGVGLLYGLCGTVNLGQLALRVDSAEPAPLLAALAMLVVAFGVKAALVPVVFWLPATYPTLSAPVAALFAGMMTKLGVYALLRTVPLLMPQTPLPEILVWAGGLSALFGVLAALAQYEVRRLLGFHIVSQVGYMVLGLGLMTVAGLAGAIFYLTHHILVKASLYFVGDELERLWGSRDLRQMGPAAGGLLAACFLAAAFSLAGLPPFSGYFAKIALFKATFEAADWISLAILVVASFYTLASMLKIWRHAFSPRVGTSPGEGVPGGWRLAPLVALVTLSLSLSLAAGPVFRFAQDTAEQLLDRETYAGQVLAAPGRLQSRPQEVGP